MPRNPEAMRRSRYAKIFLQWIKLLGIDSRKMAKDLGIDVQTIKRMSSSAPQLHVLYPIGEYIQAAARAQASS
jgi:hypothetical protein